MQSIRFIDPKNESPEEICWHNLKIADGILHLEYFIHASKAWLKLNPDKNFQDLEKELRNHNFNTHLYASKPCDVPNSKLGLFKENDKTEYIFECIFSCRPKEYALQEVLSKWPTYEENFKNLEFAGMLIVEKNDIHDSHGIKQFSEKEIDTYQLISNNTKKIITEYTPPEKYISMLKETALKEFKKEPTEKLMAITRDSKPIFGFFVDEKLFSNIGYTIYYAQNQERKMELVDLRSIMQK